MGISLSKHIEIKRKISIPPFGTRRSPVSGYRGLLFFPQTLQSRESHLKIPEATELYRNLTHSCGAIPNREYRKEGITKGSCV